MLGDISKIVEAVGLAFITNEGLPEALESLARRTRSEGVTIVHESPVSPAIILSSSGMASRVAEYLTENRPTDSRQSRVIPVTRGGFAVDFDHFTREEIDTDPFYQEFLRPRNVSWHACASLAGRPTSEDEVSISLKRSSLEGPYRKDEIEALDHILPVLRAALVFKSTIDRNSRLNGRFELNELGLCVAWIGPNGLVHSGTTSFWQETAGYLMIGRNRLHAIGARQQGLLNTALAKGLARPGSPSTIVLSNGVGDRLILDVLPGPSAAISDGVPIGAMLFARPIKHRIEPSERLLAILAQAFGFTPAEARLAACLACGWPLGAVSERLLIGRGTIRNHLKVIFAKTGTSGQAEAAALLSRFR